MIEVEIWSDVVCPFCYMGKRRFENALKQFGSRDEVRVVWRSFQLDPDMRYVPGQTVYEYLAKRKGMPLEASRRMHLNLAATAAELGLKYDFDSAVPANTFDAHRLTHMARERGVAAEMEERLFSAYFSEGRNIEDRETLAALSSEVGMVAAEVRLALAGSVHGEAVEAEMREAEELGADGVPFFVFNRAYAVAGAQPSELFLEVLEKIREGAGAESRPR